MATSRRSDVMSHPVVVTFLILAIIAFLSWAGEVFKPLALAILLTFAFAPLCRVLEKRGIPRVAAVLLTVMIALGGIGFIGLKVGGQLSALATDLPKDEDKVVAKIKSLQPASGNSFESLNLFLGDVAREIESKPGEKAAPVRVIEQPTLRAQVVNLVGPYLEFLGTMAFVLILVLFFLMNREDLGDRIIRLFGRGRISMTTKTVEEVGERISRYLLTFTAVNSSVGVIVGLGLWMLGIPYALLWGVLAAMLRFIPYAGPATAFALPLIYSIAHFTSWNEPLRVIALFAVLEIAANSFLEPIIYGRTTGVSALGLLIAAMFWTFLWGPLGLLLSTPLTVCLAVLGKYVPCLSFFGTFLGEDAELKPDVRFYQRMLARDSDGAALIGEEALNSKTLPRFYDEVVVPSLSLAERDHAHDEIDQSERDFVWNTVDRVIDDIEVSDTTPDIAAEAKDSQAVGADVAVMGVPAEDHSDVIVLRMLRLLLSERNTSMGILADAETPLKLVERLAVNTPSKVLISHLPPSGLTEARYLIRRLRARFPKITIIVGRWGEGGNTEGAEDRLVAAGANKVVFTLAEAAEYLAPTEKPKAE